jgi:hypothetical protein
MVAFQCRHLGSTHYGCDSHIASHIDSARLRAALASGMAIDANVLINETRIREELRNYNTPQASIHAGYDRASVTILTPNVTPLLV